MSKSEGVLTKKTSRRSMLKWTGALAGAAVVGAVAGVGADTLLRPVREVVKTATVTQPAVTQTATATQVKTETATQTVTQTVTPPPPPKLSYKPPLSLEVNRKVGTIITSLVKKHEGETIGYTFCSANGCAIGAGGPCLLKVHLKDGVMTAIEVGDNINVNNPRENVGEVAILEEMIQMRPCVRGRAWRQTIYNPERLIYPMKRVGQRGDRKFMRISWSEALDTVASKIKETADKRGPYSMLGPIPALEYAGPWGVRAWGMSSYSGHQLADLVTLGVSVWGVVIDNYGNEVTDLLNSKLIIGFGWNPAVTIYGAAYLLALAKEKGTKIIIVDPVLSMTAQTYADQWIPIRPGTDAAMLIAMANVLFKENLYDKAFIEKFVEPKGFAKWRDYVLGAEDGVDKTPEWAEAICGVPAETIRALAKLYATTKPAWLRLYWSASRQLYGENQSRIGHYLQAMTGSIGKPGASTCIGDLSPAYGATSAPTVSLGRASAQYPLETLIYDRGWMDAVLLREDLEKGRLSEDEYRRTIGAAKDWRLVNPSLLWYSTTDRVCRTSLGVHDLNKVFRALKKLDFIVASAYHITNPATFHADIILPEADPHFEDWKGFARGGGYTNYFIFGAKMLEPPGEAKAREWIDLQIAKRLGVADKFSPRLAPAADDPKKWDQIYDGIMKEAYEKWAAGADVKPLNPPSWEDFRKSPVWRVPHKDPPWVAFADKIEKGVEFDTPSGKIEFYSDFLTDPEMARKSYMLPRRKRDAKICFGGSVPPQIAPMGKWVPAPNSMVGPKVKEYPLLSISTHSYYRQHVSQDNNRWLRDEGRHACWMSVADAKTRSIKDGDLVRVFNELGEIFLPAYVTSRVTPGVVVVRHGAWYEPSDVKTALMPDGVDMRGAQNFLTPSTDYPWTAGPVHATNLVEVAKFRGV